MDKLNEVKELQTRIEHLWAARDAIDKEIKEVEALLERIPPFTKVKSFNYSTWDSPYDL